MAPPAKIGPSNWPENDHARAGPENRSSSCVLALPAKPVSAMFGKYSVRATPMRALAATSCCSACRMSGRRSSSAEGRPGAMAGATRVSSARSRAIGPGLRPTSADSACSCRAMARRRSGIAATAASYSAVTCIISKSETAPPSRRTWNSSTLSLAPGGGGLGDRQAAVEFEQRDVAGDDGGHQRERHAAPRFLGREQVGARRFVLATDAAPQVEFPARGEHRRIVADRWHCPGPARPASAA